MLSMYVNPQSCASFLFNTTMRAIMYKTLEMYFSMSFDLSFA